MEMPQHTTMASSSSSSSSALRFLISIALLLALASASDPSQLQDFCVAVPDSASSVFVNGKFCKNPASVTVDDFIYHGLNVAGNTTNAEGSAATPVFASQLPGLNTLGVSILRFDFGPYGLVPPHTHPRATEALLVLEGYLYVGFVSSSNELYAKTVCPGDVFVFPQGLIHFLYNVGKGQAVAIAAFGSQNPGAILVASAVFGSQPSINPDVLAKAFQVNSSVIDALLQA